MEPQKDCLGNSLGNKRTSCLKLCSTKELVDELRKREGVDSYDVPYDC